MKHSIWKISVRRQWRIVTAPSLPFYNIIIKSTPLFTSCQLGLLEEHLIYLFKKKNQQQQQSYYATQQQISLRCTFPMPIGSLHFAK